jgi:hypothetical protein
MTTLQSWVVGVAVTSPCAHTAVPRHADSEVKARSQAGQTHQVER